MSRLNIIGGPAVRELLNTAGRSEAPVIENVALARGFLWRCSSRLGKYNSTVVGCGRINGDDQGFCPGCGAQR